MNSTIEIAYTMADDGDYEVRITADGKLLCGLFGNKEYIQRQKETIANLIVGHLNEFKALREDEPEESEGA